MSCNLNPLPPRPRQRKLRSSCDGCGAAKLKCDRGRPKCGRCVSFAMPCVYGESRKFGRPPRQKAPTSVPTPPPSSHSSEQPDMDTADRDSSRSITASTNGDGMVSGSDAVWAVVDGGINPNAVTMALDCDLNALDCDLNLLGPTPPAFDFGEQWAISDYWGESLLPDDHEAGLIASASTRASTEDPMVTHSHPQPHSGLSIRDHDCLREAHEILGSLSIVNVANRHSGGSSPSDANSSSSVPLDHVLRINREASDRLGRLLVCSCCDRSPHLQLLYASIISRILLWYQQATECSAAVSFPTANAVTLNDFNATVMDMAAAAASSSSHQMGVVIPMGTSPPGSAISVLSSAIPTTTTSSSSSPSSPSLSSPWGVSPTLSSAAAGPGVGRFPSSCSPTSPGGAAAAAAAAKGSASPGGLAVAPAAMAIGTFNVDDLRMQAALKMQLLSGELRRAGRLIDLFTSFLSSAGGGHGGQCLAEVLSFGGVSNLYQILDAWLRGEHSRIASLMRSKLRELNADLI